MLKHCAHCTRLMGLFILEAPQERFCSNACAVLAALEGEGFRNFDPSTRVAVRRLAQVEREQTANTPESSLAWPQQADHDDGRSTWSLVPYMDLTAPEDAAAIRICRNCDKWTQEGGCALQTLGEQDAFAWRGLFLLEGISDDDDAKYCDCFAISAQA